MKLFLYSASCLALLAAGPALADPVAAEASSVDTLIVTASRSGEPVEIKTLGASVTVLDAEAMTLRQTRIVSDILRDVPGLAVNRLGAIGSQTQVRVRGTEGNHVLVLIDGIEASDPYQGEYDFGTLIADEAARVEVLR
ncbi:TonB-dependent receptor, partial [Pseudomonas sp. HMWF010]